MNYALLPVGENEGIDQGAVWWECWCWQDLASNLLEVARRLKLRVSEKRLRFPEFEVLPLWATRADLARVLQNTDAIEELRLATDSPSFFTRTVRNEQTRWIENLIERVTPASPTGPAVCILDNGVARSHPLLSLALDSNDCHTVDPRWGVDDHDPHGHGTNMAGAVLYGDLTYPLADQRNIELPYRLESVKFLPPPGFSPNDPLSYGVITQSASVLPEIQAPHRLRVFCMAVTNTGLSGERPTSWSSAIDQLCAGALPGDEVDAHGEPPRRLFFISAGNIPDSSDPGEVADPDEFPVEDPAQAWNAISVGGFTDKVDIAPEDELDGWKAVAKVGDKSPYSRISTDWGHARTPIKPEIVFEAGNRAVNRDGSELISGVDSLSLLTTSKDFLRQPLTTFWATSAATAQAAGMAAEIAARHPAFWPETVRALMIHSAEWTPAMRQQFKACKGRKRDCIALARQFGYGVPRLDRALASAENDLALVAQTLIQPFKRNRRLDSAGKFVLGTPTFNEVHYYSLPWPRQALEKLAEKDVCLKITLSYFIEPSPGERAPVVPARYQSHGLRFELKRADDAEEVFKQRVNKLERGEDKLPSASTDSRWTFGSQSVAAGSLHCDVWVGPAAELAGRATVAVYPVGGWWRYRANLNKYNSRSRYALVMTITSEDEAVQLYTEIANQISNRIATEVPIG